MNLKIIDHSDEVLLELAKNIIIAMEMVGLQAENNAKFEISAMGAIDTGNLRNSVSHFTDGNNVYIGTNVEYAPYVEFGTSKYPKERPFLRNAVRNNRNEYKTIIEQALKS